MKNKSVVMILVFSIIFVFTFGEIFYLRNIAIKHPLSSKDEKVEFTVKDGENLNNIIDNLKNKNLMKNSYFVKLYIKRNNVSIQIKPGVYSFSKNIPLEKFTNYLSRGIKDDKPIKVIIPEGYNLENIALALDKKNIINKDEFINSCKEYKLPEFIKNDSKRKYALEGYLFPDTYEFYKGASGKEIIDMMSKRFLQVINNIKKETGKNITNDELDKIITMASIVEKEVERNDERGKVASVFYNRLNRDMKLQSCATVLYALGKHKDKLYYNDLKVNSPYNTYIVKGLPEGPICCPGKSCILSAINPEKTNYLYFVSKNDGTHFFTDDEKKFEQVKKVTQGNKY